ncbi:MAG TPA: TIGR01841 family phasin [Allosphingosinicella sp.]|nr:TIGR01841 family phasin [Allosphingosinicella sp.]
MASQTETKTIETKADVLPKADAPKALAAEPAKTETPKAEPVKAQVVKAEPAAKPAVKAEAPKAKKPARRAASKKTIKRAKPAAKPAAVRKAKPANAGKTVTKTGVKIMNTQTKKAAETAQIAAEQIKTVFGDVNERAKAATEKTAKIVEELAEITRGNVEAMVASSKVAAKGVESMSQDAAEYGRKSFETATQAFKSFTDVKSATDFFKLQGDFARSAFDSAVAESARVSETVLKLAGDVAEPLTSRYSVAAERVKTLAA